MLLPKYKYVVKLFDKIGDKVSLFQFFFEKILFKMSFYGRLNGLNYKYLN